MVRDLGLAVSGLLNPEMGGPSVQPPLPASLLNRPEFKSERLMAPSRGADRYRRGVYVNVQRTFAYPMFKDFDAADPSAACPRREQSNTPLQALTMLNDPALAECSPGHSGSALVRECRGDARRRVRYAFRIALARRPDAPNRRSSPASTRTHRTLYDCRSGQSAAELVGDEPLPPGVSPTGGGGLDRGRADDAEPRRVHHPREVNLFESREQAWNHHPTIGPAPPTVPHQLRQRAGGGGRAVAACDDDGVLAAEPAGAGDRRARTRTSRRTRPPLPPRVKNCIFIFLAGGYEPGRALRPQAETRRPDRPEAAGVVLRQGAVLLHQARPRHGDGSKFGFRRYGGGGLEMSELLPHIGECADDIALVRSMYTDQFDHGPAEILFSTGTDYAGRPSAGAWVTYGLGSQSQDLPGYVVLVTGRGPVVAIAHLGQRFPAERHRRRPLPGKAASRC